MTITASPRQRCKPKYFVYFNDWTGEIVSVGTQPRTDTPAPFLETEDDVAGQIVRGEVNDQNYIISSDRYLEQRLIHKNEFLQLRRQEDELFLVPTAATEQWNIRARLFIKNKRLVIEANQNMLGRLVAHSVHRQIKLDVRTAFQFYLIRKNNPDYLIDVIEVDAEDLINHGKMSIDVSHILAQISLNDVSILTRRYFESYYFQILDDVYVDTADQERQSQQGIVWQRAQTDSDAHLLFEQDGKYVSVTSLVTAEQLNDVGLHSLKMDFFVVGTTPDHYMGTFEVDVSRLRMGQQEKYEVDFDIEQIQLMYRNPLLRINKRKTQ